jgi:DNA-binding LacI/PurR family transcriptional regulator
MKMVTLADIAERSGVSVALVSIVLRDAPGAAPATRERIRAVARELGYEPDGRARRLRSGRNRLLGVVFGVEHAFHGDLVTGLYDAAARHGYELTLSAVTPRRDERAAVQSLLQDRCQALILIGPQAKASDLAELGARLPVVVLARGLRRAEVDTVRTADADGLEQAVDHLVSLGHARIAHIDGGDAPGAADRRRGYRKAMRRHGLPARIIAGGPTEDDGSRAARELRDETAVTVFNDRCATGVLDTLRATGHRVPEDVSVTGFDDSRLARLGHIGLTTVAQDAEAMAELAVTRAVARIDTAADGRQEVVVPPHLVVRGTTATVRRRPTPEAPRTGPTGPRPSSDRSASSGAGPRSQSG